jgi:hypothetical protein
MGDRRQIIPLPRSTRGARYGSPRSARSSLVGRSSSVSPWRERGPDRHARHRWRAAALGAAAKIAVGAKIEKGEIAFTARDLRPDADLPDLCEGEGALLAVSLTILTGPSRAITSQKGGSKVLANTLLLLCHRTMARMHEGWLLGCFLWLRNVQATVRANLPLLLAGLSVARA